MVVVTVLGSVVLALATIMPLAWKWKLGPGRVAAFIIALATATGVLVEALAGPVGIDPFRRPLLAWCLTLAAAAGYLAYRFYRDPERRAPDRDDVVVSPADGELLYVRESRAGKLPIATKHGRTHHLHELTKTPLNCDDAIVIGIAMSFLDVHVNRAPIAGRVTLHRHFPGRFGSLRQPEMVFENERATTVIEGRALEVAVVQIASRLVRQIAAFVRDGHEVELGQRIGVIRFGSQVDVVLPARPDLRVTVRPGARLKAGESIIAQFDPTAVTRGAARPAAWMSFDDGRQ